MECFRAWNKNVGGIQNMTGLMYPCAGLPGYYGDEDKVQSCCLYGDLCTANSLCQYNKSDSGHPAQGSGYYVGGCTDPDFKDPTCRNDCLTDMQATDIVYVKWPGTWACCGRNPDGSANCNAPILDQAYDLGWGSQDFPGPLTKAYSPASSTSISSASTAGPTSTSTLQPAANATSSVNAASHSGISTGAKAGIGIGVAVVVVSMIIAAFILGLRRERKRLSKQVGHMEAETLMQQKEKHQDPVRTEYHVPKNHELLAERQRTELAERERPIVELGD